MYVGNFHDHPRFLYRILDGYLLISYMESNYAISMKHRLIICARVYMQITQASATKKVPVSVVCNAVSFPFRWRSVSVFLCVSLLNPCHIKLMVVKQLKINTLA